MVVLTLACCFVLVIILQFDLCVRRETIRGGNVDSAEIRAPIDILAKTIIDFREKLLVPPNGTEELWRKFVFSFHVVRNCIGVSDMRHFESRFVDFRPNLKMTPCEARILSEDEFAIIVQIASG